MKNLAIPLCCCPSSSDTARATWQLLFSLLTAILDPFLDLFTVLTFLGHGQLFFAAGLFFGMVSASYRDPLQTRTYMAAWSAWKRGMPGRAWLEHVAREGGSEAPVGAFIPLSARPFSSRT